MRAEMWRAGLIYGGGDLAATLITGHVQPMRAVGIFLIGALLYAPEIRGYFGWLERSRPNPQGFGPRLQRAALAWLWFNPLWIARHALFIRWLSGRPHPFDAGLLTIGFTSFALNMPVALTANYLIQNRLPLRWRLTGSASFSAVMAVYYALSEVWFG